jgi:hypothetical protein
MLEARNIPNNNQESCSDLNNFLSWPFGMVIFYFAHVIMTVEDT